MTKRVSQTRVSRVVGCSDAGGGGGTSGGGGTDGEGATGGGGVGGGGTGGGGTGGAHPEEGRHPSDDGSPPPAFDIGRHHRPGTDGWQSVDWPPRQPAVLAIPVAIQRDEDTVSQPPDDDQGAYQADPPRPLPPPQAPPLSDYGQGHYAAASAPPGMYFDPASGLTLPDGVQLASVGRRIGAYFLSIVLAIVTLVIGYVIWGLIVWGRGQTPALQVLGMRCWRPESGRVAGWWWMALREIVGRFLEGILGFITLIVSFVLMVAGRERKCLHDLIAGTVVLRDPNNVLAHRP